VDADADAACEKANKAIAKRGWPVNLVDLDRLTVRAVTDVQAASKTIRAQKAPAGSEDNPPITPAEAASYEKQLARAGRAERKGIKKLLKSIGAIPTVPGRGGEEEAPAGDDSQAA
jgi:hypothetical protein